MPRKLSLTLAPILQALTAAWMPLGGRGVVHAGGGGSLPGPLRVAGDLWAVGVHGTWAVHRNRGWCCSVQRALVHWAIFCSPLDDLRAGGIVIKAAGDGVQWLVVTNLAFLQRARQQQQQQPEGGRRQPFADLA